MIQVWILVKNESPLDARKHGHTGVICGTCPLQNGTCYVDLGKAPQGIWKAYKRGSYPKLPSLEVFAGKTVRFGAYGDPVYIPFTLLRDIARVSRGFTGYTHQWRNPLYQAYRGYVMASVETPDGMSAAQLAGWRTFRVASNLETSPAEIICPNTTRGISCHDCRLCAGTSRQAKSILIEVHGIGKKHLSTIN